MTETTLSSASSPSLNEKAIAGLGHKFDGGICTICGRSKKAAIHFGWACTSRNSLGQTRKPRKQAHSSPKAFDLRKNKQPEKKPTSPIDTVSTDQRKKLTVVNLLDARFEKKFDKLNNWRKCFTKSEYTSKISTHIIGVNLINQVLVNSQYLYFKHIQQIQDFDKAILAAFEASINLQDQTALLIPEHYAGNRLVGSVDPRRLREWGRKAQIGDPKSIEELEYGYVFYSMLGDAIVLWNAFGLMGKNQQDAFYQIGGYWPSEVNFSGFEQLEAHFRGVISKYLEGRYNPRLYN